MVIEDERTGTWHAYGTPVPSQPRPPFDYNSYRDQHKLAALKLARAGASSRFVAGLAMHFPDVAASIDDMDFGVLHLEVAMFTHATREAIQKRDWATVRMHFDFVDRILEEADAELHDAIGVSYLGNLFYGETSLNYAKARTLLPKRLAVALEIMERHYEDLAFFWRAG